MPSPRNAGRDPEPVVTQTIYKTPYITSTYDPDGLIELFQSDVDWDDTESWKGTFPLVTHGVLDESTAGPAWGELSLNDQNVWITENEEYLEELGLDSEQTYEFGSIGTNWDAGNLYNQMRDQGMVGGTEIDYDYYRNEPLFALAWATIDWERAGLDDPHMDALNLGAVDLTEDHIWEAYAYLGQTFKAVADDRLREPWDAPMPEAWVPVKMDVDYKTPFTMPKPIPKLASPKMSQNLQDLKVRSGSQMEQTYEDVHSNLNPTT